MSNSPKIKCFIIMPFSETKTHTESYWTSHYDKFLKPLIEEADNIEVFRSQAFRGAITSEIIMNLIESEIVVADITDYNPNVFWELGVRHSFKHGTITIAEEGTKIPFDIKDKSVLFYDVGHLNEDFKIVLKEAIQDCCDNPEKTDSPILEAISGRGTLYGLINKENIIKKLVGLEDELHTNELCAKTIINDIKTETDPSDYYFLGFNTSCLDHLFIERYLDNFELDAKDYHFEDIIKTFDTDDFSLTIYFVLWTIRINIDEIRLMLRQYHKYEESYLEEELNLFKEKSEQIRKDLNDIIQQIENTF